MPDLAQAALIALGFLVLLAASGRLGFVTEEIPSRTRRIAALAAWWATLVLCVFYPSVAPGDAADVDPQTLWFPTIFTGQLILAGFLLVWWLLAQPLPVRRFLRLEHVAADDVRFGLWVGVAGWCFA